MLAFGDWSGKGDTEFGWNCIYLPVTMVHAQGYALVKFSTY